MNSPEKKELFEDGWPQMESKEYSEGMRDVYIALNRMCSNISRVSPDEYMESLLSSGKNIRIYALIEEYCADETYIEKIMERALLRGDALWEVFSLGHLMSHDGVLAENLISIGDYICGGAFDDFYGKVRNLPHPVSLAGYISKIKGISNLEYGNSSVENIRGLCGLCDFETVQSLLAMNRAKGNTFLFNTRDESDVIVIGAALENPHISQPDKLSLVGQINEKVLSREETMGTLESIESIGKVFNFMERVHLSNAVTGLSGPANNPDVDAVQSKRRHL